LILAAGLVACAHHAPVASPTAVAPSLTLTVVGTSDLHGALEPHGGKGGVAALGGYLRILRARGPVALVDGGDMFQGTIISNLAEGAPVVRAMNALGYTAAAIGNHEFDYGPEGPDSVAIHPDEDPRGALRARAREAHFPFLGANIIDEATDKPVTWDNVHATVLVTIGGIKVGIVGGTTQVTPTTTNALNLRGMRVEALPGPIRAGAEALRKAGAEVVIAAVHAGSACGEFSNPDDVSSCRTDGEVFRLANALPPGLVDVIVGGHTHAEVAHRVNGIAVVQAGSRGAAFGQVDLTLDGRTRKVVGAVIHPPHKVRAGETFEGSTVVPDAQVAATFAGDIERAVAVRARPLGVTVTAKFERTRGESPLGNLVADLLRASVPGADLGLQNGGGLRADLDAGPLLYDGLYEVLPFDNHLAVITLDGPALQQLFEDTIGQGMRLYASGMHVVARCPPGSEDAELTIKRDDGRPIDPKGTYRVVVADFLAAGGDGFARAVHMPGTKVEYLWGRPVVHDVLASILTRRGGALRPEAYDGGDHPRVTPARCGNEHAEAPSGHGN
jgi:5'-nucleotidase